MSGDGLITHVNSSVIDQDVVHFEIGGFAGLLILKLDEGVLKGVPCLFVSYHLATNVRFLIYELLWYGTVGTVMIF